MKGIVLALCVVNICLLAIVPVNATVNEHEIQVDFTINTQEVSEKTVSTYRLYKENELVCEAEVPVGTQTFNCTFYTEDGTFNFYLAAYYTDETESLHSAPFPFTITTTDTSLKPGTEGSLDLTFSWETTSGTDIVSYRFYMNDTNVCESDNSSDTSIACKIDPLNEVMQFSMSSVSSVDGESAKSNILVLDPADYPQLFIKKSATFSWDYNADETDISGFQIYQNGNLICETSDSSARQLSCLINLSTSNSFKITAMENTGLETTASNVLIYNEDQTSTGSETLKAVLTTSSLNGVAPLTLTFDGTGSTGDISTYTWDFGDGDTASGTTTSHVYAYPGSYTTTLTVADAGGLTHQDSAVITVTEASSTPSDTDVPPEAVISSSSAIGEAPLTVQFDGSGSTATQTPISLYTWEFGDSSSATGSTVNHTFTAAGTYQTTLTITDSVGLTDQTSTPVLITDPPDSDNQVPIAAMTIQPESGQAPLNVTFNGSGSSDSDGSISDYQWGFGDGSTATGISVQHTFVNVADYTITLQVTDNQGAQTSTSKTVSVLAPGEIQLYFELGEVQVDNNWAQVSFDKDFIDPVVIAGPPLTSDSDPVTIRIRNVTATGFEVRLQEWDYQDDTHSTETFSFIAIEKGVYTLEDGRKVEAASFNGSSSFKKISLQQTYSKIPVILTQIVTANEANAVTGRVQNVVQDAFEFKLQEQETTKATHGAETVGYLAWEPGKGEILGVAYETGVTTQSINQDWFNLTFQTNFPETPLFIAEMQTSAGGDTAVLRLQSPLNTGVQVKVEEEQSKDSETKHVAEAVGYLAVGSTTGSTTTAPPSLEDQDKRFTFTWEYSVTSNVSGFRFYLNDSLLCESTNPDDRLFSCNAALLNNTMTFTMTAVFFDGSESAPSTLLSISPFDFPDLFGIRLVTFTWEFDSSQESLISGFQIFNNDTLICETTNTQNRQIVCETPINQNSNNFSIKAVELSGTKTNLSNTLLYNP
ncbi:PKD domain-containing protein [Desulfopila sp. IMCC35008]|uniref:PKD domain-containing protein n=1 Tax=Desulfopila sp. IMCC35008 TaxID=2653858 RepID=UPI0013CFD862|nr:PKD domain-containing protein [Desulfopila sp. IMCC35008]